MNTSEARAKYLDSTVSIDGDIWTVIGVGAVRDETVYLHMASTTRFRKQRNGNVPVQYADFLPLETLEAA